MNSPVLVDRSYELFVVSEVGVVIVSDFPLGLDGANRKIVFGPRYAVLAIAVSDGLELLQLLRDIDASHSGPAAFWQHADIPISVVQTKKLRSHGASQVYVPEAHGSPRQNGNTGNDLTACVFQNGDYLYVVAKIQVAGLQISRQIDPQDGYVRLGRWYLQRPR